MCIRITTEEKATRPMGRFTMASMGRAFVDGDRSESVKKRVYLPDVDEFRSSSGPLSEVILESLGAVSCTRAKPVKEGYVADLTREGGVSPCSVILGLLYIHRLTESNPRYLRTMSGKDLFLTAMMIASKYLNDEGESEALTNSEWAEVGCRSKPALDLMERKFLAAIDWRLYVSLEEYYSFVTGIEGKIALNQFALRGWLTYTDLVTLWDTVDTQRALLTATKQVAKVTCGSAAVYLVLLSTLFTASHAIHSTWSSPSSSSLPSHPPTTTTTTTSNSLQAAVAPLMMKEPPDISLSVALDNHNDSTHWKYNHQYCLLKNYPLLLNPRTVDPSVMPLAVTSVPLPSSPPSFHHPNAYLHRPKYGKDAGTVQQLKRRSSTSYGTVFERRPGNVFGQRCNQMDRGTHTYARSVYDGTVCGEEAWPGTMNIIRPTGIWYVINGETLPMDYSWQKCGSGTNRGAVKLSCSDEWVNWSNLYTYFESLFKWIANFALIVFDISTVMLGPDHPGNDSSPILYHTLVNGYQMQSFGDPFTVLPWDGGGNMAQRMLYAAS